MCLCGEDESPKPQPLKVLESSYFNIFIREPDLAKRSRDTSCGVVDTAIVGKEVSRSFLMILMS